MTISGPNRLGRYLRGVPSARIECYNCRILTTALHQLNRWLLDRPVYLAFARRDDIGGEGGIRTPDRLAPMPHFECGAFDHSATSPEGAK